MFPIEIGSDYTQEQKNQMTLFLVSINLNLIMNKYSLSYDVMSGSKITPCIKIDKRFKDFRETL